MRRLYLAPIIHMEADLGSFARAAEEAGIARLGQVTWQRHKDTVSRFWDAIAQFFESLNVAGFRIYQDGLVADGMAGLEIVREGVIRGSKNFAIIGGLLERGAILVKTEDPALVQQEYGYLAKLAGSSASNRRLATLRYKLAQGELLRRRDDYIAATIRDTLHDGESGVLFIGAYHNVDSRLPDDILVRQIKAISKVREYQSTIVRGRTANRRIDQLAAYLTSPAGSD